MEQQLDKIERMLQKHSDDSNAFRSKVLVDLAIIQTKAEETSKSVSEHSEEIDKLKDKAKESTIFVRVLSAIGLAGIVEYIRQHVS